MKEYIMSADIGKKRDFFAVMIMRDLPQIIPAVETTGAPPRIVHLYEIVHIDQARNLRYEQMAEVLVKLSGHAKLSNNHEMIIDGTGVGEAVVDLLRQRGVRPIPIVFTAGDQVTEVKASMGSVFADVPGRLAPIQTVKELRVPKNDMVSAGMLMLQQARLTISQKLALGPALRNQLEGFRGKVNEKGRTSYNAETEALHDDLVVCFLMAAWWALRGRKDGDKPEERTVDMKDGLNYDPWQYM